MFIMNNRNFKNILTILLIPQVTECKMFNKGEGKIIPCLIEHYEQINFPSCKNFLNKMAAIIFSDYTFMDFFIQDCQADIQQTRCGRLNEGQVIF